MTPLSKETNPYGFSTCGDLRANGILEDGEYFFGEYPTNCQDMYREQATFSYVGAFVNSSLSFDFSWLVSRGPD